jgi:hypothetical protein
MAHDNYPAITAALGELRKTDPNFAPPPGVIGGDQPPYVLPAGADLDMLNAYEQIQVGLALASKKPIPAPILDKLDRAMKAKLQPVVSGDDATIAA